MSEIDELLESEDKRDILEHALEDVDDMDSLIIVYRLKNGTISWKANCFRTEGIGLLSIVKKDLMNYDSDKDEE